MEYPQFIQVRPSSDPQRLVRWRQHRGIGARPLGEAQDAVHAHREATVQIHGLHGTPRYATGPVTPGKNGKKRGVKAGQNMAKMTKTIGKNGQIAKHDDNPWGFTSRMWCFYGLRGFHQKNVDFSRKKEGFINKPVWISLISPSFKEWGGSWECAWKDVMSISRKWNKPYRIHHFITISTGVLGFGQHDLKEPRTL